MPYPVKKRRNYKLVHLTQSKFNGVKSILSKVSCVAKNVIYIPKLSNKFSKNKSLITKQKTTKKVEFSFGSYFVTTINSSNPLIENVQKLRYLSFFGNSKNEFDKDEFDQECDHLVVIDKSKGSDFVVGTYRLLIKPKNITYKKFYSETEFEIKKLFETKDITLLEAGRSCVVDGYRDGRIIRLLWRALATYIFKNNIDLIFGCASFPSANYRKYIKQLSYLHNNHAPPEQYCTNPLNHLKAKYNVLNNSNVKKSEVFRSLPPLIKAYIRAGAWVGKGAIVDKKFDTTDVLIILKSSKIIKKYSELAVNE